MESSEGDIDSVSTLAGDVIYEIPWWEIAALGLLLVASALLSCAYISLLSLSKSQIETLKKEEESRAKVLISLIEKPGLPISLMAGIVLANVASSAFATHLAFILWGNKGLAIAIGGMFLLIAILAQIVPRSLARQDPVRWAIKLSAIIRIYNWLISPIVFLLIFISGKFVGLLGGDSSEELEIVPSSPSEGGIALLEELYEGDPQYKKEIIQDIFELSDKIVREVMIPRIDIVGVEEDSTVEEVSKIVEEAGHSRIPIYKETLDNIIGVIHAKALLWVTQKDKPIREVEELIRPPYFVPDTKNIYDLLRAFQRRKTHLAIVLDEYGGTAGLVTMEDIIEEIFGEIQDEYDTEEPHFKILDDNSIILDAIVSIEDAQDIVEVRFPEGEFETIGGFAFAMFGRIPREGETLQLDDLKVKMVMEKVEGHRISKIRIIKLPDKDNDGGKTKSETSKAEDGLR